MAAESVPRDGFKNRPGGLQVAIAMEGGVWLGWAGVVASTGLGALRRALRMEGKVKGG